MATILVVDDDEAVRRAVRKTLESRGHEVAEATDGPSGVAAFEERRPDLVITDVYMPGGDGLEGVTRILGTYPDSKVIVMTGGGWDSTGSLLEKAKSLGAAGALRKPFGVVELIAMVNGILGPPSN
jgi:CheY-like chemotaxis protein